jgi:hypothetical protein
MSMAAALPNVPPADELADIRAQLKALEKREDELKALMLSDPSARTGNAYVAEIREVTSRRTDIMELRATNPDLVDEYTFTIKTARVELKAIDQETGEITSLRRKSA